MKTELTIISDDLNHGIIDENEARTLLLGLLGVSNCYDRADMEYAYNADKDWQPFDKFIEEYDAPI
jgi:hypothetical protein